MALNDFISINFPYCMKQTQEGGWFLLNREYKPIGFCPEGWVTYTDYPICIHYERFGYKTQEKVASGEIFRSESPKSYKTMLWLYNDSTNPKNSPNDMDNYFKKLKILSKLCIKKVNHNWALP